MGFEKAGFVVVQGPDAIWGRSIREFHPPPGRFDGVIGGDPCQAHSALSSHVRHRGLEPSFPDMTPWFEKVVEEARPRWFLRENVVGATDLKPQGYAVRSFVLDNWASLGEQQRRMRRFWFGMRYTPGPGSMVPDLRQWIDFALVPHPDPATAVAGHDGHCDGLGRAHKAPPPRSLEEMLRLQGLPEDLFPCRRSGN
jgi:hypothetical protein